MERVQKREQACTQLCLVEKNRNGYRPKFNSAVFVPNHRRHDYCRRGDCGGSNSFVEKKTNSGKNREFCREVLDANLYYRKEDITQMTLEQVNPDFGTYNIFNAAYNYCNADDVQLLLDVDDEFIERYTTSYKCSVSIECKRSGGIFKL